MPEMGGDNQAGESGLLYFIHRISEQAPPGRDQKGCPQQRRPLQNVFLPLRKSQNQSDDSSAMASIFQRARKDQSQRLPHWENHPTRWQEGQLSAIFANTPDRLGKMRDYFHAIEDAQCETRNCHHLL